MDDQSLFKQETPTQQPSADQPQTLFTIGDRAYNADSAKTKIENADTFINTLKEEKTQVEQQATILQQENARLQAQLEQSAKLEDALSMFTQQQQPDANPTQQVETPSLDVEALKAALKAEVLADVQASKTAEVHGNNFAQSMEAAQKAFGTDVAAKLQERGAQIGMDTKAIDKLAKENPLMFNELFIPKAPASSATPDGFYSHNGENPVDLEKTIDDWGDRDKFWSSQSKAQSLRAMEKEVTKLVQEGKLDPHSKTYF